jgi:type IV secretory pathway VirB10-like protein
MEKNLSYYIKHPEKAMEISESEMKAWLEQYPYSAAVRMLRARKSLDGLAPASKDDIIRAADYVSDPLFLYYQLLKNEEKETETLEAIRNWKKEESGPSSVNKVLPDAAEEGPVVPDEPEQTASPPESERKTGNKEEIPPEQKPEPRRSTRPQTKRSTSKSADKAQPKTTKKPSVIGPTPSREDRAAEQAKKQEVVKEALQAQKSGPLTFSSWLNSLEPVEGKEKPKTGAKSKKKKPKKSTKKRSRLDKLISQSIAEKEEAISETYADLLISQGYTEKAKEVLRKLLLKFPEKSGYFAAKIENLDKE